MWLLLQCLGVTTAAAQSQTPLSSDAVPRLTIDTPIASEGYFVLRWDARSVAAPRLQGPATGDFTTAPDVPVMPEGSLTVTGLRDGEYLFRVGSEDNWSEVLRVRVRHHALSTAFAWFGVGALLFMALVIVTVSANHRCVREERESLRDGNGATGK